MKKFFCLCCFLVSLLSFGYTEDPSLIFSPLSEEVLQEKSQPWVVNYCLLLQDCLRSSLDYSDGLEKEIKDRQNYEKSLEDLNSNLKESLKKSKVTTIITTSCVTTCVLILTGCTISLIRNR